MTSKKRNGIEKLGKLLLQGLRYGMVDGRKEKDPYNIHVSSLYDFCVYRCFLALKYKQGYSPPKPLDTARALTFKQGNKSKSVLYSGSSEC
jgi:hypothetical protein